MSQVPLILSLAKRSHALRGSASGILVPVLPIDANSVQLPCGTSHTDASMGLRCSCSICSSAAASSGLGQHAGGLQAGPRRALRGWSFPAAALLSTSSSAWPPVHVGHGVPARGTARHGTSTQYPCIAFHLGPQPGRLAMQSCRTSKPQPPDPGTAPVGMCTVPKLCLKTV